MFWSVPIYKGSLHRGLKCLGLVDDNLTFASGSRNCRATIHRQERTCLAFSAECEDNHDIQIWRSVLSLTRLSHRKFSQVKRRDARTSKNGSRFSLNYRLWKNVNMLSQRFAVHSNALTAKKPLVPSFSGLRCLEPSTRRV